MFTQAFAKSYPELIAKQANENLRLVSADGKFTYYQRRSGSLHFSRNYKIIDVLKSDMGTQYTLFSTPAKKKIIVLQNTTFHTFLSLRMREKIYLLNYGEAIPREIGLGTAPALHLDDSWLSYFDSYSKTIYFEHTLNTALKFSIKLNNKINPYFIPQVIMSDENTVWYTDLSENGVYGLLQYKRNQSKSDIVYKTTTPSVRFEIQKCSKDFIFAEIGYSLSQNGTFIYKSEFENFSKKEKIYHSDLDDLGHLTCDYNQPIIYFVKNSGTKNLPSYDIAEIDLNTKKVSPVTDTGNMTTVINMDGILLSVDKGKYVIVKGSADLKNVDSLKIPANQEKK